MVFAMACFVFNDACVKFARQSWETGQILVVRGVFALILLGLWMHFTHVLSQWPKLREKQVLLRGFIEATIAMSFITALGSMALADITAILLLSPLFITGISMVFMGEKVGWRRWLAIFAGFGGMLLVIRPEGQSGGWPVALAIFSALGVAVRDTLTNRIPAGVPNLVISVSSTIGGMIGGGMLAAGTGQWAPMDMHVILALMAAALFVVVGNFAIILAFRGVELSAVSPFRYTVIIWAVLMGGFVFGQWPAPIALIGIAMIGLSGLYTLHRERMRRKEEKLYKSIS